MNLQVKNQNPKPKSQKSKTKTQKPKIQNQNPKTKFQNPKSKTLDPKSKILNAKRAPKAGNLTTFKVSRALPAAGGSGRKLATSTVQINPPDHFRQRVAQAESLQSSRQLLAAGAPGRKFATSTITTSRPLPAADGWPRSKACYFDAGAAGHPRPKA